MLFLTLRWRDSANNSIYQKNSLHLGLISFLVSNKSGPLPPWVKPLQDQALQLLLGHVKLGRQGFSMRVLAAETVPLLKST